MRVEDTRHKTRACKTHSELFWASKLERDYPEQSNEHQGQNSCCVYRSLVGLTYFEQELQCVSGQINGPFVLYYSLNWFISVLHCFQPQSVTLRRWTGSRIGRNSFGHGLIKRDFTSGISCNNKISRSAFVWSLSLLLNWPAQQRNHHRQQLNNNNHLHKYIFIIINNICNSNP